MDLRSADLKGAVFVGLLHSTLSSLDSHPVYILSHGSASPTPLSPLSSQSTTMNSLAWNSLPHEMQLAVLDAFPPAALNAFSRTCKSAHAFAVPAMFSVSFPSLLSICFLLLFSPDFFHKQSVTLPSFSALVQFLDNVPEAYWSHIRALDISTKFELAIPPSAGATPRTDALVRLLSRSLRLERLTLRLSGGLASHVIHCFPHLRSLHHLEIENCDDEEVSPLYVPSHNLSSFNFTNSSPGAKMSSSLLPPPSPHSPPSVSPV